MRRMRFFGPGVVLFVIAGLLLMGLVVSGLWNALMPAIFGLRAISFWQALGLFLLGRLLFGRFGGWGPRRSGRFARGWHNLKPDERDRFREAMAGAGRCGPPESAERV